MPRNQAVDTEVQCSVFSGFNKGSERIVTINRFSGNITSTINYILEFVNQRMNHSMIKLNDSRKNIDAYPQRALFEGVINAAAHRDYYLDGTQIQVDMYGYLEKSKLSRAMYFKTKHDMVILR